jgi:hypothetical protein
MNLNVESLIKAMAQERKRQAEREFRQEEEREQQLLRQERAERKAKDEQQQALVQDLLTRLAAQPVNQGNGGQGNNANGQVIAPVITSLHKMIFTDRSKTYCGINLVSKISMESNTFAGTSARRYRIVDAEMFFC